MSLNVLAVIPARSGSKGIPHKNVRLLQGKPLLAHSIEQALASRLITRTIVSTDSAAYAKIARQYGAETPFLRPATLAQDLSTDLETFEHALNWLRENEGYVPDIIVHLRPTYPARRVVDIDTMIQILIDRPEADSVRSVVPAPETPYKMWLRDETGWLTPVAYCELPEAYNQPRQRLPQVYLQNANIDVVRARVITEQHSMTGRRILGFVMAENYDIDTEAQLGAAAAALAALSPPATDAAPEIKTFCVDIDGVIATLSPGNRYDLAQPRREIIDAVNALYDNGQRIVLFTARGSATGLDWTAVTERQLADWGVRHHELRFGKPAADYYIDDRAMTPDALLGLAAQTLAAGRRLREETP